MQLAIITVEEFVDCYQPIANHLDPYASFDWGQGHGTLFETFGNELEFVRAQTSNTIWTYVSGDGDEIISGYHFVNRVGYFITKNPAPSDTLVCVALEFDG